MKNSNNFIKNMNGFPEFMKNEKNHISSSQQNTPDIDGYYFEGQDGSQMAFWTYYSDRISKEHKHDFDDILFVFLVNIQRLSMVKNYIESW